ncbi:MAG: AAA family ATPase [Holdemania massiliensis]
MNVNRSFGLEKDIRQLNAALNELCLKQSEPLHEVHIKVEKEWIFEAHGQPLAISDLIRLEKDDLEAIRKEMDAIVGLQEVKDTLKSMEEHYKVTQLRQKQGLKAAPLSRHMIFTGNPGTGKTTMARLVARLFKALGLLSQGQLIEVSRSDLVGRYVGHTAPLTQQIIESALGGVLFIDEAYSLVARG